MISICNDCGHRHRGKDECLFCDCVWQKPKKTSWLKKIINWFI